MPFKLTVLPAATLSAPKLMPGTCVSKVTEPFVVTLLPLKTVFEGAPNAWNVPTPLPVAVLMLVQGTTVPVVRWTLAMNAAPPVPSRKAMAMG